MQSEQVASFMDQRRVLVVDDNEASAKTMGWTLELMGHEVTLAYDAQTALEAAKTFQPAIILLDIGLPGMNGYELCRQMRQDDATKHAIIIAQTGWGQSEHRLRSKDAGFDHHLVKPVNMETLEKLIDSVNLTPA
jgi:CheY-like chemotaxis protein